MATSSNYADAYNEFYFQHYNARTPEWLQLWATHADTIIRTIGPQSVLDAGCARGLLVESLRDRGVEAFGVDVSAHAIAEVREDIKPYCRVASVADPLPRRYDLIFCHEVLEHLPPEEAKCAIANFCRASDDILIGTTPGHYHDPTHINVQPPEYWAALFAEADFWHDVEYDASFLSPWAKRFRKRREPVPRAIAAYERKLWLLKQEVDALRGLVLQTRLEAAPQPEPTTQPATTPGPELEQTVLDKQRLAAELGDAATERQRLEAERDAIALERDDLRRRLSNIENRFSWQMLAKIWRLQLRAAPPSSPHGRAWLALTRQVRKRVTAGDRPGDSGSFAREVSEPAREASTLAPAPPAPAPPAELEGGRTNDPKDKSGGVPTAAKLALFGAVDGWTTKFTVDRQTVGGEYELCEDPRLLWFLEMIGGVRGRRVLELGPMEGAHSKTLAEQGAAEVVAIEGLERNWRKCLIVQEVFGLGQVRFLQGDFRRYVADYDGPPFDAVLASGVLYHQPNPAQLIFDLARITERVLVWSQVADDTHPTGPETTVAAGGRTYRGRVNDYHGARDTVAHFCGGVDASAVWLYPAELHRAFTDAGFAVIIEQPISATPYGPSLLFVASKAPARSS